MFNTKCSFAEKMLACGSNFFHSCYITSTAVFAKGSTSQTFRTLNFMYASVYVGMPNVVPLIGISETAQK